MTKRWGYLDPEQISGNEKILKYRCLSFNEDSERRCHSGHYKKGILGSIIILEAEAFLQHILVVKAQHTSCQRPYKNSSESQVSVSIDFSGLWIVPLLQSLNPLCYPRSLL